MKISGAVNIYLYFDYRHYLGDFYNAAKKQTRTFSYRFFSKRAGVKAPNFLQWLIEGKRNLTLKSLPGVIRALGLDTNEAEYLKTLVFFENAETIQEKSQHFLGLIKTGKPFVGKELIEKQYLHYNKWYNSAIRELLNIYDFNPEEKWAYRKLGRVLLPSISESQARQSIEQLLALGLAIKDGKGFIKPADNAISTGDEVKNMLIRQFHQAMITLAGGSLDRVPKEQRDISSLTMSISDDCFNLIKKEVQQFRKRIMELITKDNTPNNVYQLNFQFYPLTNKCKMRKALSHGTIHR